MKKIISFLIIVVLFSLAQNFAQAQTSNKGFPDNWVVTGGWDATKTPSVNQSNPNNLLPRDQQKIAFGEWLSGSAKVGSVTTGQFSLTGVTNLSLDVAYNEYYISYMRYSVLISTNNGTTWNQLWMATSTGSTNWKWRTILLNLSCDFNSSFTGNARLKFEYDGPEEGDLVAFDLGKLLETGLFTTNTAPVITLLGDNPLYLTSANLNYEPGYSATDTEDGNLTSKVQITTNLVVPGNGIFYRAYTVKDAGGLTDTKTRILIVSGITNVNDENLPTKYLLANYPNPFNPTTTVKYDLPGSLFVKLNVYNTLGQEIVQLVNEEKSIGSYEVEFNAASLPSGTYFYILQTKNKVLNGKMMFLK